MDDFRQMASDDETASDNTAALARAAAKAIRGLNHATRRDRPGPAPRPPTTSSAPCPWPRAGLGQLLTQITGYLDRSLQAGRLGHDLGEDPALHINAAGAFPGDARRSAAALAGDLSQAQEQLAYVNGCPARRNPQDQP